MGASWSLTMRPSSRMEEAIGDRVDLTEPVGDVQNGDAIVAGEAADHVEEAFGFGGRER